MSWIVPGEIYVLEPCECLHSRREHLKDTACVAHQPAPRLYCDCRGFKPLPGEAEAEAQDRASGGRA